MKLHDITNNETEHRVCFYCPGCESHHWVVVRGKSGPVWQWNGDRDKPTFTPSVLVRTGHYAGGGTKGDEGCWCNFEERTGKKSSFKCSVCHSFVTDGKIRFLGDCTHSLAGQTVELPECEF